LIHLPYKESPKGGIFLGLVEEPKELIRVGDQVHFPFLQFLTLAAVLQALEKHLDTRVVLRKRG
jgi:hypothetical protein